LIVQTDSANYKGRPAPLDRAMAYAGRPAGGAP
jgi:hypothetical protein